MKTASLLALAVALSACSSQPVAEPVAQAGAPVKISITTKSPEALTHFQRGEALLENLRTTEAVEEFNQALKLDPEFAAAKSFRGFATPGPDGLKEMEVATLAAATLPEAERVLIEGNAANRRGDLEKARSSYRRVIELAPTDFLGHYLLGQQLLGDQKYADAAASLRKATELNPTAGGAQNMLGYAALRQGDTSGAIAAFEQYAKILPQEPNAHDSLGEALLGAGRFQEAEAAFQKSLEVSPQFWAAHEGMAYTKLYRGDWAGGKAALVKAKETATRWADKIQVDDELVGVAVAQRNTAQALKMIDAIEKTVGPQPSDVAFEPLRRGLVLLDAGRAKEALVPIATALTAADGGKLPVGLSRNLRREALRARVAAEAQTSDTAAAQKTSATLDADAAARADDPQAQTAMHFGRAMLAVAQRDPKGAQAQFDQCSREDQVCLWQAVVSAEKAGDKAAAGTTRDTLLKVYARDPGHLIIRSRLATPGVS